MTATENKYSELIDCTFIGHLVLNVLRYDKLYVRKYRLRSMEILMTVDIRIICSPTVLIIT
ncbi:hypothetical protein [Sulfolobus sp. S-194]|uniref:hypothetical protein n=1 Tax=Sulfolobus sp. S-194 TaxID=2512240 RepID=UPI0019D0E0EF|nr:hypothetical protein [Sulfolobus sp. S-194]